MLIRGVAKNIFMPMMITLSAITASAQNNKSLKNSDEIYSYRDSSQLFSTRTDLFSYYGKDGKLKNFNLKIGQKWQTIETDNTYLKSIINAVREKSEIISDRCYIMLDKFAEIADSYDKTTAGNKILENKELKILAKNIKKGRFNKEEVNRIQTPEIYEVDNWSEGLNRRISYIKIAKSSGRPLSIIRHELDSIGKELGFKVAEVDMDYFWLEDYSIRRCDGKIYRPVDPMAVFIPKLGEDPVITYSKMIEEDDIVNAKSYLEGGNVLNTLNSKGEPSAIIGYEAIKETLLAMNLNKNKMNIARAKVQIAEELGLKPQNITYIPQIDFHIDMYYRPLQNGVVAAPDYDMGINILKETELPDILGNNKEGYISRLEDVRDSVSTKLKKAENILMKAGYKIIKMPVFSHTSDYGPSTINYMNGICGTAPNGKTFYITNKSEIDELDKIAEKYFKEAGIDKVYFVSTLPYLIMYGGIDCLTQEM